MRKKQEEERLERQETLRQLETLSGQDDAERARNVNRAEFDRLLGRNPRSRRTRDKPIDKPRERDDRKTPFPSLPSDSGRPEPPGGTPNLPPIITPVPGKQETIDNPQSDDPIANDPVPPSDEPKKRPRDRDKISPSCEEMQKIALLFGLPPPVCSDTGREAEIILGEIE